MEIVKLMAQQRQRMGKGPARRLRQAGRLPAVLYGHGQSAAITITPEALLQIRQSEAGENTILELLIEGDVPQSCHAILREIQIDPVSRVPLHVDLYRVSMDEPITVTVALEFVNIPESRLKQAQALLNTLLREIEVECLPRDIPEAITVDLSGLEIGRVLHASGLTLPPGVRLVTDSEEPVVTTEREESGAAEAAGAAQSEA